MIEQYLPLSLSLAAAIVAGVSSTVAYLIASGVYLDADWPSVARPVANLERGVLAATGIVALAELVRSARRGKQQQQHQSRDEHRGADSDGQADRAHGASLHPPRPRGR